MMTFAGSLFATNALGLAFLYSERATSRGVIIERLWDRGGDTEKYFLLMKKMEPVVERQDN